MARTNWKKKFEEASKACSSWQEDAQRYANNANFWKGKYSALKGHLTRERKKNAEAWELVGLLEWAKEQNCIITFDEIEKSKRCYRVEWENPKDSDISYVFVNTTSLLESLREAKKRESGK